MSNHTDSTQPVVGEDEVSSNIENFSVWDFFEILPTEPGGDRKASCTACGKVLSAKKTSGTSNMKRHVPMCFNLDEPKRFSLVESNFKIYISDLEWARIEKITQFLKPFYDITTLFSGSTYPTSNLYFLKVWKIQLHIEEAINSADDVISNMAKEMKKKFDKYWETYSMVLSFGIVLDPRYKLKMVDFCFSKLKLEEKVRGDKLKIVSDAMHKLYDREYGISPNTMHSSSVAESSNVVSDPFDELDGFESFESQFKSVENEKSELTLYLEETVLDRKQELDVLKYWKNNQGRYPKLSLMARDILSIPITTVASESSFSIGGQVLNKYRSSLASSNVEALLCTRDWLFDLIDENDVENELEEGIVEDIEALIPSYSSNNF